MIFPVLSVNNETGNAIIEFPVITVNGLSGIVNFSVNEFVTSVNHLSGNVNLDFPVKSVNHQLGFT
jgi:hypothetical protein